MAIILATIAIVSPKDPTQRWLINLRDFNQSQHTRWEDRLLSPPSEQPPEAVHPSTGRRPTSKER